MSIIKVEHLSRRFGDREILKNISFSIPSGEMFGLIGLNGAGKTTLIRTILGLIGRDKGTVSLFGEDPYGRDVSVLTRVGTVLEHCGFYGNLGVLDNLKFYSQARGLTKLEYDSFVNDFVSKTKVGKNKGQVKYFSRGEKMQCALLRAFMGWPELLVFDEPTLGLDIGAYENFIEMSNEAIRRGTTILISSHHLEVIDQLCDTIGLLENGTLTILDDEKNRHLWTIRILNNSQIDANDIKFCIKKIVKSEVSIKNDLYSFRVNHEASDTAIPEIVRALVELGCAIAGVKPEIRDIKENLKNFTMEDVGR